MIPLNRELWLPVLRPEERSRLVRIHEELAAQWASALATHLQADTRLTLSGPGFETFGALAERDCHNSRSAAFIVEREQVAGFVLMSSDLAIQLVDSRLGASTLPLPSDDRRLTRLEEALVTETVEHLLAILTQVYQIGGLGRAVLTRLHERLKNTMLFAPEVYLLTFRLTIDPKRPGLNVVIAVAIELVKPLRDLATVRATDSTALRQMVGRLPLEVEVELGTWDVTLAELANLRPGDSIILPDGQDAWLCSGGVRVKPINVQVSGRKLVIEPRLPPTVADPGVRDSNVAD